MPSILIGNPLASGAQIIVSGNPWSGTIVPITGLQLRLDKAASGNVYIGLSGGTTMTSGGMFLSGGGLLDGFLLGPGDAYFIPKGRFQFSGTYNVYARHDVACSGQARLYYEAF